MEITIDFINIYNFLMTTILGRIFIYGGCIILGILFIGLTGIIWYKVVKFLFSKIFNLFKIDDEYGSEITSFVVSILTYIIFMPLILLGPEKVENHINKNTNTNCIIEYKLEIIDSKIDALPDKLISADKLSYVR